MKHNMKNNTQSDIALRIADSLISVRTDIAHDFGFRGIRQAEELAIAAAELALVSSHHIGNNVKAKQSDFEDKLGVNPDALKMLIDISKIRSINDDDEDK